MLRVDEATGRAWRATLGRGRHWELVEEPAPAAAKEAPAQRPAPEPFEISEEERRLLELWIDLTDQDPEVVVAAIRGLVEAGDVSAIPALLELLSSQPGPEVRSAAEEGIEELEKPKELEDAEEPEEVEELE